MIMHLRFNFVHPSDRSVSSYDEGLSSRWMSRQSTINILHHHDTVTILPHHAFTDVSYLADDVPVVRGIGASREAGRMRRIERRSLTSLRNKSRYIFAKIGSTRLDSESHIWSKQRCGSTCVPLEIATDESSSAYESHRRLSFWLDTIINTYSKSIAFGYQWKIIWIDWRILDYEWRQMTSWRIRTFDHDLCLPFSRLCLKRCRYREGYTVAVLSRMRSP